MAVEPFEIDVQPVVRVTTWFTPFDRTYWLRAEGLDGFVAERAVSMEELAELRAMSGAELQNRREAEARFDAARRCLTLSPNAYRVVEPRQEVARG